MKSIPLLLAALALPASAVTITRWNFNSPVADGDTGTGTTNPSLGAGTASLLGVTASFSSGDAQGGSSDPASGDDSGWQTTSYPTINFGNLTEGVQFNVDTTGYENISISYDLRHSNSSSRYEAVQYTLNGTTWSTPTYFTGAAGDTWFNGRLVDLSAIAAADNNPNFAFRIVAAFENSATGSGSAGYVGSNTGTTYAGAGTWRFDMATVSGTAVPEPTAALLGSVGLLGLLRRRR